jgi:hypothetical protein
VCAVVRNKLARAFEGSADDVERVFGSVARERGISSEADALEYIQRATGLAASAKPVPIRMPSAPAGHYAVFVGPRDGPLQHVIYGRKLPNGDIILYDPQTAVRYTWDQAIQKWGRGRPWLLD